MVEMPMIPLQPAQQPAADAEAAAVADAPQGAFEEMLARRLGRQLVGRFAGEEHPRGAGAGDGQTGSTVGWAPPEGPVDGTVEDSLVDTDRVSSDIAVAVPEPLGDPATTKPAPLPLDGASEPTPVRVHVNRPGFPQPIAEAGLIQPGPEGDVWTGPSGSARLELTRGPAAGASRPTERAVPEPPAVHWSPAPARAALAAAANRDLELEIVNTLTRERLTEEPAKPLLEAVSSEAPDVAQIAPPITTGPRAGMGTSTQPGGPAAPGSLIDRVLNAVEMQRHLPPPRSIAVDIPEMEGLRILVTMRMDGTVHLASSSAAGNAGPSDQATPLLQAVQEALTDRGFDMSADTGGRRGQADQFNESKDDVPQPRSFRFRRPGRRASGLRI